MRLTAGSDSIDHNRPRPCDKPPDIEKQNGVCQDQPTGLVALANFFGVLARGSHKPTARVREG